MHELTQQELADKTGVSRQTIISMEKGKYTPSLLLAMKTASIFNITVEDLFELEKQDINIARSK